MCASSVVAVEKHVRFFLVFLSLVITTGNALVLAKLLACKGHVACIAVFWLTHITLDITLQILHAQLQLNSLLALFVPAYT